MNVLSLNCGSSSVKYALLQMPVGVRLCAGIVDRVTVGGSFIKHSKAGYGEKIHHRDCPTHAIAFELLIAFLTHREVGVIRDLSEIDAVGHRVVHGGERFTGSVSINDGVVREIEDCTPLAPLHNPANLAGIRAAMQLMPNIPHAAIFDTAFFSTLPPHIFVYALPFEWYTTYNIRKYGFHGTSHRYVAARSASLLKKQPSEVNIITLHIGNGVSVTAVRGGAAYDHSMGFTPLEGAVMGTRCGDIDPAIPLYVMRREALECEEMENILNKKSGLLGITGKYSDRREILKAMDAGDKRAKLSFEIECYRLRKYIGAYAAGMGGLDAIAFTAGVGENSFLHRSRICRELTFFGIEIDDDKNIQAVGGEKDMDISAPDSRVRVFVIPTNEELVLAEETLAVLNTMQQEMPARSLATGANINQWRTTLQQSGTVGGITED